MKYSRTRNIRNPCIHRLKRQIVLEDKQGWFITKRDYRGLWRDKGLYKSWSSYSRYLYWKHETARLNHRFMVRHRSQSL